MSCRVAGRHVEDAFFYWMLGELKKSGFETLRASYIPTLKNVPVKDFLPSLGAKELEKKKDDEIVYDIALGDGMPRPKAQLPIAVAVLS
jgi:predicted enzyme involved in methoxymalonyl-ACP biosynthesis